MNNKAASFMYYALTIHRYSPLEGLLTNSFSVDHIIMKTSDGLPQEVELRQTARKLTARGRSL